MATKVRKQVYIEPRQELLLKRLAREQGVTEAEIIRRAIDRQTRSVFFPRLNPAAWEAELAYLRRLAAEGAVRGERTWKREDLHGR